MGMQLELFKALRSVKVASTDAEKVVEELEGHIAMKIDEANKVLIEKIDGLRWLFLATISLSVIAGTIGGYIAFLTK
jgi:hypothetical protein